MSLNTSIFKIIIDSVLPEYLSGNKPWIFMYLEQPIKNYTVLFW